MQQTPTKQNKVYECAFLSYHSWTSWKQSVALRLINDLKDACTLPTSTWSTFSLYIRPSLSNQVHLTFPQTPNSPQKSTKKKKKIHAFLHYIVFGSSWWLFSSPLQEVLTSSFMPLPPSPARCFSCLERTHVKSPPLGEEPGHWKGKPSKVQLIWQPNELLWTWWLARASQRSHHKSQEPVRWRNERRV